MGSIYWIMNLPLSRTAWSSNASRCVVYLLSLFIVLLLVRQVMGAISWIVDWLLYEEAVTEAEEEQRLVREEATHEEADQDDEEGPNDQVWRSCCTRSYPAVTEKSENFILMRNQQNGMCSSGRCRLACIFSQQKYPRRLFSELKSLWLHYCCIDGFLRRRALHERFVCFWLVWLVETRCPQYLPLS